MTTIGDHMPLIFLKQAEDKYGQFDVEISLSNNRNDFSKGTDTYLTGLSRYNGPFINYSAAQKVRC